MMERKEKPKRKLPNERVRVVVEAKPKDIKAGIVYTCNARCC